MWARTSDSRALRVTSSRATRSVEQVGLEAHDPLVQRLEAVPAGEVRPDLAGGEPGVLLVDGAGRACRLGQQLGLARALHGDEPPRRLVDRLADREQPVVLEDHRL